MKNSRTPVNVAKALPFSDITFMCGWFSWIIYTDPPLRVRHYADCHAIGDGTDSSVIDLVNTCLNLNKHTHYMTKTDFKWHQKKEQSFKFGDNIKVAK